MAREFRYFILLIISAFLTFYGFSQEKNKLDVPDKERVYEYYVIRNTPDKAKNFSFIVNPFILDLHGSNINIGAGAELYFRLRNRVSLHAQYRLSFHSNFQAGNTYKPVGGEGVLQNFDLVAAGYFLKKFKKKDHRVTIHSARNTRYVVKVPGQCMKLMGVRFGYNTGRSNIANDVMTWSGYGRSDMSKTIAGLNGQSVSAMVSNTSLVVGFVLTKVFDLRIDIEEYGKKNFHSRWELYADLLISMDTEISNVMYTSNSLNYYTGGQEDEYYLNDATAKIPVGFRAGFREIYQNTFTWTYGAEIGMTPGVDTGMFGLNNGYLLIKVGLILNFKIG